jgi:hypothetical protein
MKRVHIEFQRVQTWLFAVPRLRAMVGANTLLGETLRVKLPDLARSGSKLETRAVVRCISAGRHQRSSGRTRRSIL